MSPSRTGGRTAQAVLLGLAALTLAACAGGSHHRPPSDLGANGAPTSRYSGYRVGKPYQVNGVWYYPKDQPDYDEIGIASWYGEQFHNHYTADGEVFDMHLPSAAHKTLPLPSLVEVTNLANGRTLIVRVNDRGPFIDGRVIDLSREAASELGFVAAGVTRVRVRYVGQAQSPPDLKQVPFGPDNPAAPRQYQASAPRLAPPAAAPVQLALNSLQAAVTTAPAVVAAAPLPAPMTPAPVTPATPPVALPDVDSLLSDQSSAPPVEDTPVVSAPLAVAAAAPPVVGGYEVQAGVFSSQANAQRVASGLSGAGAPEVQSFVRGSQTLYRVVVRGFTNPTDAAATRGAAAALGVTDARVVTLAGGA